MGSQVRVHIEPLHEQIDLAVLACTRPAAANHIIKFEAGPESADREITCRACGGHFLAAKENSS
jgi:hypothetical protein